MARLFESRGHFFGGAMREKRKLKDSTHFFVPRLPRPFVPWTGKYNFIKPDMRDTRPDFFLKNGSVDAPLFSKDKDSNGK